MERSSGALHQRVLNTPCPAADLMLWARVLHQDATSGCYIRMNKVLP